MPVCKIEPRAVLGTGEYRTRQRSFVQLGLEVRAAIAYGEELVSHPGDEYLFDADIERLHLSVFQDICLRHFRISGHAPPLPQS